MLVLELIPSCSVPTCPLLHSRAGAGDDTLNFTAGSVSILATTIKGGAGADNISLYGANDVVFDIASGDYVFGGTGADTLLFTGSVSNTAIQAGAAMTAL